MVVWYLVAAVAAAAPIPLLKEWTRDGWVGWIALSAVSYATLIWAYTVVLRDSDISVVYPFLKVLSVLVVVGAGLAVFSDRLTIRTGVGITLGAASIYLLSSAL